MRIFLFCLFAALLLALPALHAYEPAKDTVPSSTLDRIAKVLSVE